MQQPGPYAYGPQPHVSDVDPYRGQAPGAAFAPIGSGMRWLFAAIISLMGLAFGIALASWTLAIIHSERSSRHQPDETLMIVGIVGIVGLVVLLYAQIAVGLVWLHKVWSWVPWDQRYTKHWRGWLTPSQVALMMLIPYFHYYWMFVANCGLCDALDRLRVSYPTREAAPKNLAIAACVCQLLIPFPVGSILWLVFMGKIDRMTREMSAGVAASAA